MMYCNDTRQNIYMPGTQGMQQVPMMQAMPGMQGMQQMPTMQGMQPQMQFVPGMQGMQPMVNIAGAPQFATEEAVSPFLMAGVQPPETPVFNVEYTQGYLATQIGSKVRVEFLIGTNSLQDRRGTLLHVGISYIIILEEDTDDQLLCDIYSIKFVTFYR